MLSIIRNDRIRTGFHFSVLTHHLFVTYYIHYQLQPEKYIHDDKYVRTLVEYSPWYFTFWNFAIQTIYFAVSFLYDFLHMFNFHAVQEAKTHVKCFRNYIFRAFAFPAGMTLFAKFWTMYYVDPNYLFSAKLKEIMPNWLNHSVHTNVMPFVLLEIFITSHGYFHGKSKWNDLYSLAVVSCIYFTCFFSIYFYHGVWLYPAYEIWNWTERMSVLSTALAFLFLMYRFGGYLSNTLWQNEHSEVDIRNGTKKQT